MRLTFLPSVLLLPLLTCCGGKQAPPADQTELLPATFLLQETPAPLGVRALRASMPQAGEVAVIGRVKDFTTGRAVFTIVDSAVPSCADRPGDNCTTPWDYCCEDPKSLAENTATIECVDASGLLRKKVEGVAGITHLTTVVVVGTAKQDEAGNLLITARGLKVKS